MTTAKKGQKFWCVVSRFFDNGNVKALYFEVNAPALPSQECNKCACYDEYRDYFEIYDEVQQFLRDCRDNKYGDYFEFYDDAEQYDRDCSNA